MPFDGIVTRSVVHSLQPFAGGRITKIYQPTATDCALHLRTKSERGKLLISINAAFARLHLTQTTALNPKEPPMFCMLLRKHLEGAIIESIVQVGLERIVHINLKTRNEFGDLTDKKLIIELMGRHSNLILVDSASGTIIDSMKHLTPAVNRYRTVLPGEKYVAPPDQGKLDPLTMAADDLIRRIDWNGGRIDRQIVALVSGFSPLVGKEILHRAGLPRQEAIARAFQTIQTSILENDDHPNIVYQPGGKDEYHVIALTHLDGRPEQFRNVHEMLDHFYAVKAETDAVKQKAGDLSHFIGLEWKKNASKLKKLEKTLKDADKAAVYRLYGELLTANMHRLRRGDKSASVVNYYDENQETLTIPLNPNRTPSENSQAYFKKYNKAKTAKKAVGEQILLTKNELDYFDGLLQQMKSASLKDIDEIREELEEGGYLRKKAASRQKKKKSAPELDHFYASDGTEIIVGKNNKQNDYLSTKVGRKEEIWLHAKDIPGSHVVIRSENPSEKTLSEAAAIAAFFSKSRLGSRVPVDYTKIKYVKKPNGAKPGYVIYTDQKTLFVTPDESLILNLKQKPEHAE